MSTPSEYRSYRAFVAARLDSAEFGRGSRKRLADELRVHASYVSLALSGRIEFTPEQGLRIARFLGLDPRAEECAWWMLCRDRAGTVELARYCQAKIDGFRRRFDLR